MNRKAQLNRIREAAERASAYLAAEDYTQAFNELGFIEQVAAALRTNLPAAPQSIINAVLSQKRGA